VSPKAQIIAVVIVSEVLCAIAIAIHFL